MPAGQVISGSDGRVELLTVVGGVMGAGAVIGELPRVRAWSLEAVAAIAERGGRVMASNDDGVEAVAATLGLTGALGEDVGIVRAKAKGAAGNAIDFTLAGTVTGGGPPDPPAVVQSVTVVGTDITVEYSGAESPFYLTALRAAIVGSAAASALVEILDGDTPGAALDPNQIGTLSGGIDGYEGGAWTSAGAVSRSWSASVEYEWQESQLIPAALQADPSKVGEMVQLKLYPHDSVSGRVVYSGLARIAAVSVPSEVEGTIRATMDLTGNSLLRRDPVVFPLG